MRTAATNSCLACLPEQLLGLLYVCITTTANSVTTWKLSSGELRKRGPHKHCELVVDWLFGPSPYQASLGMMDGGTEL
jgi:hypothetical protein